MAGQITFSIFKQKKNDEIRQELENITALKENLVKIGYNPGEVDYLVKKFTKGNKIEKLDIEKLYEIKKALQDQLDIAKKCFDLR